ncbi:MAG: hypothetical protein JW915_20735 [Chitinispirillaceae bacterium]|nr:hypothetical protein [Chitinispirillaceae bacterium]
MDAKRCDSGSDKSSSDKNISATGNKGKEGKYDLAKELLFNLVFAIPLTIHMGIKFMWKKFTQK